jgi:hypothetical protein
MKAASLILVTLALAGCGSGSSSPAVAVVPAAATNESAGGFWVGTDSDDQAVIAVVSEGGLFYFLDGRFETGFGLLNVINGDFVHGVFQPPLEPGVEFPLEVSTNECKVSGTVSERDFMTLDVQCKTEENQQVLTTLDLNYDIRYERDSSLASIAGDYGYTAGMVLSVDTIGSVFGQDAITGRVIDGQVTVINPEYNLYDVEWSEVCCVGGDTELVARVFSGFALLDNSVNPEQLIIAVSRPRDNSAAYLSVISFVERL